MGLFDFLRPKKRKTSAELLRENQRTLNRAGRELDRENNRLEMQEKKLIFDIKKTAQSGQMGSLKVMAKDLVRTRQYQKKFTLMRANVQAISLKVQGMKSQDTMAQVMCDVSNTMASMNRQLNLPQIKEVMNEFEKQSQIMDMKDEFMGDAIDDAMSQETDDLETDAIVQQVLDELNIQMGEQLGNLPVTETQLKLTTEPKCLQAIAAEDAELQTRVEKLRCK